VVVVGENQIEVDTSSEAGDPMARRVELQDLLAIGLRARAEYDAGQGATSRPDLKAPGVRRWLRSGSGGFCPVSFVKEGGPLPS